MLQCPLQVDIRRVPLLVNAVIKLHNFCLSWGDDGMFREDEISSSAGPRGVTVDGQGDTILHWLNDSTGRSADTSNSSRREELADFFESGRNGVVNLEQE